MKDNCETDEQRLERFGYRQELNRRLGYMSSFALSFSVISVTTGLFANYGDGLRLAGPAFIWTWPLVGTGQFLLALLFARLERRIPLSGYAYQWTRELAGERLAWWAGWMMIVQFLTGLPGVCYALANYLMPYLGLHPTNRHIVLLTVGILALIALINHFGITLASLVNNASVATEILGTIAVGVLLLGVALIRRTHPWSFLFAHPNRPAGFSYLSPFAFSAVMSAWTLTGFESAANLAEETRHPERRIPGAIVLSEVSSVALGFLVLVGFTLAIPSLAAVSRNPTPLLFIMASYFPPALIHAVMFFVFISIFACALANLTSLTRMVWAMARDHQLPASGWLGGVSSRRVPARAIWTVTLLSSLFVLWARFEIVIIGIAALAGYITYALVVGAVLWPSKRLSTDSGDSSPEAREQHATPTHSPPAIISKALGLGALAWLLLLLAMLSLPRSAWQNVLATLVAAAVGMVCYRFWRRREEDP
jgi:amino acid transporter